MIRHVVLTLIVCAVATASLGQSGTSASPDPALQKAIDARTTAQFGQDPETWARYTTDDFLVVGVDGVVKTKAQRMAEIKAATPVANRTAAEDQVFRAYGPTVIYTFKTTSADGPIRVTLVWVKQGTDWKAASAHVSRITNP